VINDRFEQALADLQAIVEDRGGHLSSQRPELARFAAELMQSASLGGAPSLAAAPLFLLS